MSFLFRLRCYDNVCGFIFDELTREFEAWHKPINPSAPPLGWRRSASPPPPPPSFAVSRIVDLGCGVIFRPSASGAGWPASGPRSPPCFGRAVDASSVPPSTRRRRWHFYVRVVAEQVDPTPPSSDLALVAREDFLGRSTRCGA
jgi:hypothetical protein